jgi:hypothetical protein
MHAISHVLVLLASDGALAGAVTAVIGMVWNRD